MNKQLEKLYNKYRIEIQNFQPIKYKDLILYPIMMKDIYLYEAIKGILTINMDNPHSGKPYMTMLYFIDGEEYGYRLHSLVQLLKLTLRLNEQNNFIEDTEILKNKFLEEIKTMKVSNYSWILDKYIKKLEEVKISNIKINQEQNMQIVPILENEKVSLVIKKYNGKDDFKITDGLFVRLRQLIAMQNGIELPTTGANPEIINAKEPFQSDGIARDIDQLIDFICVYMKINRDDILNNWSVYQLSRYEDTISHFVQYNIYNNGQFTFKNAKDNHWKHMIFRGDIENMRGLEEVKIDEKNIITESISQSDLLYKK